MDVKDILRGVELFDSLNEVELEQVVAICQEKQFHQGQFLTRQGAAGDELFIITQGFVEVLLEGTGRVVVNLGSGQIIGEMSLVDQGPSSATVRALDEPTIVQAIRHDRFDRLCQQNTQIGYKILRNLAADISFKLRHSNLSER